MTPPPQPLPSDPTCCGHKHQQLRRQRPFRLRSDRFGSCLGSFLLPEPDPWPLVQQHPSGSGPHTVPVLCHTHIHHLTFIRGETDSGDAHLSRVHTLKSI